LKVNIDCDSRQNNTTALETVTYRRKVKHGLTLISRSVFITTALFHTAIDYADVSCILNDV